MKKIIGFIFAFISFSILFSACGGETYADKLKKQEKAINAFLSENNISVIKVYPEDNVFAPNQYYKDDASGYYVRVIDKGNDERPIEDRTTIYLRYDTVFNMLTGDLYFYPNTSSNNPMTFTYNKLSLNTSTSSQEYYLLSSIFEMPLREGGGIGRYAEVSFIVPFESGSYYQQYSGVYMPFYFKRVIYDFKNDLAEE